MNNVLESMVEEYSALKKSFENVTERYDSLLKIQESQQRRREDIDHLSFIIRHTKERFSDLKEEELDGYSVNRIDREIKDSREQFSLLLSQAEAFQRVWKDTIVEEAPVEKRAQLLEKLEELTAPTRLLPEGIGVRKQNRFEIIDPSKIPSEYLIVDEKALFKRCANMDREGDESYADFGVRKVNNYSVVKSSKRSAA